MLFLYNRIYFIKFHTFFTLEDKVRKFIRNFVEIYNQEQRNTRARKRKI